MLTAQKIQECVTMAGRDLTWPLVKAARPHSDIRTALAKFLWEYANGICVFCDTPVSPDGSNMCHIVSSGGPKVRRGYVAGNLANGCKGCNDRHALEFPHYVPLSEVKRPELVPVVWPLDKVLRREGRLIKARRAA